MRRHGITSFPHTAVALSFLFWIAITPSARAAHVAGGEVIEDRSSTGHASFSLAIDRLEEISSVLIDISDDGIILEFSAHILNVTGSATPALSISLGDGAFFTDLTSQNTTLLGGVSFETATQGTITRTGYRAQTRHPTYVGLGIPGVYIDEGVEIGDPFGTSGVANWLINLSEVQGDSILLHFSYVPEPGVPLLLLVGLATMAGGRFQRHSSRP